MAGYYPMKKYSNGLVFVHIAAAERALGRRLPIGAIVHHADEDTTNNDPSNLVICPSRAYHALLHARMRALAECGNASWRKCNFCGKYDAPTKLRFDPRPGGNTYHMKCRAAYYMNRHREKRNNQPTRTTI